MYIQDLSNPLSAPSLVDFVSLHLLIFLMYDICMQLGGLIRPLRMCTRAFTYRVSDMVSKWHNMLFEDGLGGCIYFARIDLDSAEEVLINESIVC